MSPILAHTGGVTVIENTIDRGFGYTRYGDHFGMHCDLEIVLANGEVMRRGMGACRDRVHGNSSLMVLDLTRMPFSLNPITTLSQRWFAHYLHLI